MHHIRSAFLAACALLVIHAALSSPCWAKDFLPRLGGEQRVNIQTAGSQIKPSIATDAEGNYAVSWLGPDSQNRPTIWVRLFDAAGAPRTGEIRVAQTFQVSSLLVPKIAMAPDGRFVVSWYDFVVLFQRFDAAGHPQGETTAAWNVAPANIYGFPGDVAMGADGRFLIAFELAGGAPSIFARLYDQNGSPLEEIQRVSTGTTGSEQFPRALALADGSYLVTWVREQTPDAVHHDDVIVAARRPAQPGPWSAEVQLNAVPQRQLLQLAALAHADGGFSIAWTSRPASSFPPFNLRARRFNADGSPTSGEAILPWSDPLSPPALAENGDGQTLAIVDFLGGGSKPQGKLFDRTWKVLNFLDFPIVSYPNDIQIEPAVAGAKDGFVTAWSGGFYPFPLSPITEDGSEFGIFAQRFGEPRCVAGSRVLCLGDWVSSVDYGRFEVSVDWRTPDGETGSGHVAEPFAWETGAFWFFQEDNLELVTKVLDGSDINDRFWVFTGALSNVEYTLKVVDTATGAQRTYHNPQGELASRADTGAFPGGPPPPAPATAKALALSGLPLSACGDEVLCLSPGRELRVGVDFIDPRTGLHGVGKALALTRDTGAFSFFNSNNLELIVKLLDGGAINGKIWFFYGGLSDLDYTITVEDPASHATRTYHNLRGQLASRADTHAFNASPPPL